jgi:hypothetical protein
MISYASVVRAKPHRPPSSSGTSTSTALLPLKSSTRCRWPDPFHLRRHRPPSCLACRNFPSRFCALKKSLAMQRECVSEMEDGRAKNSILAASNSETPWKPRSAGSRKSKKSNGIRSRPRRRARRRRSRTAFAPTGRTGRAYDATRGHGVRTRAPSNGVAERWPSSSIGVEATTASTTRKGNRGWHSLRRTKRTLTRRTSRSKTMATRNCSTSAAYRPDSNSNCERINPPPLPSPKIKKRVYVESEGFFLLAAGGGRGGIVHNHQPKRDTHDKKKERKKKRKKEREKALAVATAHFCSPLPVFIFFFFSWRFEILKPKCGRRCCTFGDVWPRAH